MNTDGNSGFPELVCAMYAFKKNAAGTGGAFTVTMQPPNGERWRVIAAQAFHDGVAARTLQWRFADDVDYFDLVAPASLAASALSNLYMSATGSVPVAAPVICTPQGYLVVVGGAAFLNGEKIYIQAIIERIKGIDNV